MQTLFKVLTAISVFALTSAHGEVCKHRIFFLPQSHEVNGIPNVKDSSPAVPEVAASQLKIVNYLDRFPQMPVFSEQMVTEDISIVQFSPDILSKLKIMIHGIFPNGFAIDPKNLNELQVQKLKDNGGEFIQLMRGRLSAVHRVMEDKQTDDRIFGPILKWFAAHPNGTPYPPEIARLIYGAREEEALRQVDKFLVSNPMQRDVALIFGANHNFSFYSNLFPPQCIFVPPEFQKDWEGQFRVGPEGFSAEAMRTGVLPSAPNAAR